MKNIITVFCASIFMLLSSCTSVHSNVTSRSKPALQLFVFECGEIDIADMSLFAPGVGKDKPIKFAGPCFIIKHPRGVMLWDSGLSDELAKEKNGLVVRDGKVHLMMKKPFLDQLKLIDMKPHDVNVMAFSHFHADHVGNANAFKGATLFIQEEEYDAAFGATPEKFGFDPKTYGELKDGPIVKLNGDHDVFGDGSVIIKRAIGHTPGHQALFIDLPKTGPTLLSGDLYHFADNRTHQRVPGFNFNADESRKSMTAIENFVQEKNATMWIQHDYEHNKTLHIAPSFYE